MSPATIVDDSMFEKKSAENILKNEENKGNIFAIYINEGYLIFSKAAKGPASPTSQILYNITKHIQCFLAIPYADAI